MSGSEETISNQQLSESAYIAAEREKMIHTEILSQEADIICLQEVDRLEKLLPVLDDAGYSHQYAAAPGKQHGLLIAFKNTMYKLQGHKMIQYDEQEVRNADTSRARVGISFKTRNIANMVALEPINPEYKGVVVATTHLFWHPLYTYERCRQAGLLARETRRFREQLGLKYSCIIAGDFNFPPDDAGYNLLVGNYNLLNETPIEASRVVHVSADPTVPKVAKAIEDEGERLPPSITNARPATPEDGLLSTLELINLFSANTSSLRSAYDTGLSSHPELTAHVRTFGDRLSLPATLRGAHEPEWTSYTVFWKSVLDYIFILDPIDGTPLEVTGILEPHTTNALKEGLPQAGICGSDHVSLCAELE